MSVKRIGGGHEHKITQYMHVILTYHLNYRWLPGGNRQLGRAHRIGMAPAAGVTDGGDVIDVDAEA